MIDLSRCCIGICVYHQRLLRAWFVCGLDLYSQRRQSCWYRDSWGWSLRWRHNGRDGVSNHQPHYCLLNRPFRHKSKKRSKLRVTGLCAGNSPGTGEFPEQMASNAENVSIWWRHRVMGIPISVRRCRFSKYRSWHGRIPCTRMLWCILPVNNSLTLHTWECASVCFSYWWRSIRQRYFVFYLIENNKTLIY